MTMQVHQLKCWPESYREITQRDCRAELRQDDRAFAVGDLIVLREYEPTVEEVEQYGRAPGLRAHVGGAGYTGAAVAVRVVHVKPGGVFGIPAGYALLTIDLMAQDMADVLLALLGRTASIRL